MARDRLNSVLTHRPADAEVLDLLGETLCAMNDLPAAGAAWFLSARADEEIAEALTALRARYPKAQARALALRARAPLSDYPPAAQRRLQALRLELLDDGWSWYVGTRPEKLAGRGRRGRPATVAPTAPEEDFDLKGCLLAVVVLAVVGALLAVWAVGVLTLWRWWS